MSLPDQSVAREWIGRNVLSRDGQVIGPAGAVLADDSTGAPEWVAVSLVDGSARLVPLLGAEERDGDVVVQCTMDDVLGAPPTATDHVDVDAERELSQHYGLRYSTSASPTGLLEEAPPSAGGGEQHAESAGEGAQPEPPAAALIDVPPSSHTDEVPSAGPAVQAAAGNAELESGTGRPALPAPDVREEQGAGASVGSSAATKMAAGGAALVALVVLALRRALRRRRR